MSYVKLCKPRLDEREISLGLKRNCLRCGRESERVDDSEIELLLAMF